MTGNLSAIGLALVLALSSCGSANTVRVANVAAVFSSPTDSTSLALAETLAALEVVVASSTDDGGIVLGRFAAASGPGAVRVDLVPDSLGTLVRVESTTSTGPLPDLGMRLLGGMSEVLGEDEPLFRPQAIFPPDSTNCRARTERSYSGDGSVQPPALVGDPADLLRRADYTRAARQAGIEGRVLVAFVVDTDGDVPCAMVVSGLPGGLNDQAMRAVLSSDFEPGTVNGSPVRMRALVPFAFRK